MPCRCPRRSQGSRHCRSPRFPGFQKKEKIIGKIWSGKPYPLVNFHNYGTSPFFMGKSTISTGPFSMSLCLPEAIFVDHEWFFCGASWIFRYWTNVRHRIDQEIWKQRTEGTKMGCSPFTFSYIMGLWKLGLLQKKNARIWWLVIVWSSFSLFKCQFKVHPTFSHIPIVRIK